MVLIQMYCVKDEQHIGIMKYKNYSFDLYLDRCDPDIAKFNSDLLFKKGELVKVTNQCN